MSLFESFYSIRLLIVFRVILSIRRTITETIPDALGRSGTFSLEHYGQRERRTYLSGNGGLKHPTDLLQIKKEKSRQLIKRLEHEMMES